MNEVKKQIINYLKMLDHEDPFQDRNYDMEIKDDKYDADYIKIAINQLVKEKIIEPTNSQIYGNQNIWMIHRKKLFYYAVENNSEKAPIVAIATTKEINSHVVMEKVLEEAENFGLKETDFELGFPVFYKTVDKSIFHHYDIKIKA